MLEMFDYGHRKRFFDLWSENLHDDDTTVEQLEFYLNVHFAIFARKHGIDVSLSWLKLSVLITTRHLLLILFNWQILSINANYDICFNVCGLLLLLLIHVILTLFFIN